LSVVLGGVLVTAAAPSAGATSLLACTASQTATFSPPLKTTLQSVAVAVQTTYGLCVNAQRPLEFRTGTASAEFPPATLGCDGLLVSTPGVRTITWSTGGTSTFSFTAIGNTILGGVLQVTQTGTITAGEFSGSTAVGVLLLAAGALDPCDTTGVSSLSGPGTFTIAL
jgi:hypothetical protein